MRISDWSADLCSSDLTRRGPSSWRLDATVSGKFSMRSRGSARSLALTIFGSEYDYDRTSLQRGQDPVRPHPRRRARSARAGVLCGCETICAAKLGAGLQVDGLLPLGH